MIYRWIENPSYYFIVQEQYFLLIFSQYSCKHFHYSSTLHVYWISKITSEKVSNEKYPWEPYPYSMFLCHLVTQKLQTKSFPSPLDEMKIRITCAYDWSKQKNYYKISDGVFRLRNIARYPHIHIHIHIKKIYM